jgi:hypothetical protein
MARKGKNIRQRLVEHVPTLDISKSSDELFHDVLDVKESQTASMVSILQSMRFDLIDGRTADVETGIVGLITLLRKG